MGSRVGNHVACQRANQRVLLEDRAQTGRCTRPLHDALQIPVRSLAGSRRLCLVVSPVGHQVACRLGNHLESPVKSHRASRRLRLVVSPVGHQVASRMPSHAVPPVESHRASRLVSPWLVRR